MRHPRLLTSSFRIKSLEQQNLIWFLLIFIIPLMVGAILDTKFDTRFLWRGIWHVDEVAFRDGGGDTERIFEDGFDWTPDLDVVRCVIGVMGMTSYVHDLVSSFE